MLLSTEFIKRTEGIGENDKRAYLVKIEAFMRNASRFFYSRLHFFQDGQLRKKSKKEKATVDDFMTVWRAQGLPEPFANDAKLAMRVADLTKFLHLTYKVRTVEKPFQNHDSTAQDDCYKRSMQKTVRRIHGV